MEKNFMNTLRKAYGQPNLETIKTQINDKYIRWASGDFLIYFKKNINFNNLNNFFEDYNYDVIVEVNDNHIYIKSKNSDDYISTEYCITGEKYKEYLLDFENECKVEDPENNENWEKYLENMKEFDTYHMIKTHTETESKFVVLLGLYILKENGDVLVYDAFNGVYLNQKKLHNLQELMVTSSNNNIIIDKIVQIAKDGIKNYLTEVDESMLEENGKLYYMNDEDGTIFDWTMNGRLCEFMSFYDNSRTGAIKINVLSDGNINVYLYKEKEEQPFKTYQKHISKEESHELAVLMYNIADKRNLYGKAINDMNSDIKITQELYNEFANPFNEKTKNNMQNNKSKIGGVLFVNIIVQLVLFVLFGVFEKMPLLLGIIFFLLIPTNIILFLVYIVNKTRIKKK